jgi:hypothetical protein
LEGDVAAAFHAAGGGAFLAVFASDRGVGKFGRSGTRAEGEERGDDQAEDTEASEEGSVRWRTGGAESGDAGVIEGTVPQRTAGTDIPR